MTTTRVLVTALPYSLAQDAPFHLSAFLTHRLDPGALDGTLADFPAALDWPATLAGGRFELLTDASPSPLPLQVVSVPASAVWTACLPSDTPVTGFPAPQVSTADWRSFPASRTSEHAVDLHLATLTGAPTARPGVLANPAISGVLDRIGRVSDTVGQLRGLAEKQTGRADALLARRTADAAVSLGVRTGRERGYTTQVADTPNGLGLLLEHATGDDERTTAMLDAAAASDTSGDPELRLLADAHATRRYYDRPEEQTAPQPEPTPGARVERPERPVPDFHARCSSFGATPVLLRRLGLVVDLVLAPADRTRLGRATWVAVRFVPGPDADVTRQAPPLTRVGVSGTRFEALSSTAWVHGAVPLGEQGYVLLDLDPDASGLKLDQHLRDLTRQAATEVNGDAATSAPGSLRTSGFAVARTDRVDALRSRLAAAEALSTSDDAPGELGPTLTYDDVVRGLRLEVWDDRTNAWHSLHDRLIDVTTSGGAVLADVPDTGFLQGSSLNRVPGAATYNVHEVIAGWDGWSLSAPRPGRIVVHAADGSEQVVEQVPDQPATGVVVTSRVAPGTLPRLRWGWSYAFRLVGVDLAGNSVPRPVGPAPDPGPGAAPAAAVSAARRHLARVAKAYAARDRASLLTAVRARVLATLPGPEEGVDGFGPSAVAATRVSGRASSTRAAGTPAAGLRTAEQRIAAFVPEAVRTGEADIDAALAERIADGASARLASPLRQAFEQVARATRVLGERAPGLRVRPQLGVEPARLAEIAGADDPVLVTLPRPYLRWAPVPPPTLVATAPLTTGEQLSRLVIRSGLPGADPDAQLVTARHVVPAKTTQLDAETAGRFDGGIGSTDPEQQRRAYAVALNERFTLLDEVIGSLSDANAGRTQPGIALAARPGADPATEVTLAQITAHRDTPLGEGQYVVHEVDDLVLPYLPDPHAAGVALVFYDAGAPHLLADPRPLQAVVLPFPDPDGWPQVQPLRLLLTTGASLGATLEGRTVRITVPPGEQVRVAMSSSLRATDLDDFGLWRSHLASTIDPDGDGQASAEQVVAAAVLLRAATAGWTWWLTPSSDLRLVHAVPAPVTPPQLSALRPLPRPAGLTVAPLVGLAQVHGASTDRLVVRGAWSEWVDDVAGPGPVRVDRADVLVDSPVGGSERFGLLWLVDFQPFGGATTSAALEDGDIGLHRAIASFPDTHHRRVTYTPSGVTRYAEMFTPDDLPAPDDPALAGAPVTVDIPSSARPAAPEVVETVPLIRWSTQTEPEQPFAVRRVRRSGARVWLRRPWFSSGDGELLAVVLSRTGTEPLGTVSVWGRDPISSSPSITAGARPPLVEVAHLLLEGLTGAVVPRSARPVTGVVQTPLVDLDGQPTAAVFGYQPEYHAERGQWFVDIALDDTPQLWPFVRLAVARYQPSAIDGCLLSPTALTDWVQPLPTRTATVGRPDADHVRVTLTGTVSFLRAVRGSRGGTVGGAGAGGPIGLGAEPLDADTPVGPLAGVDAQVAGTRRVTASVQVLPDGGTDLQWRTVATRRLPAVGADPATWHVTWTGELALPVGHDLPLATPGSSARWRVLVEEVELLDADAPDRANLDGVTTLVPRTVYLDTIAL